MTLSPPVQGEPVVSDLRRGGAVRDGKRVMAEETVALGKVRETPLSVEVIIRKGYRQIVTLTQLYNRVDLFFTHFDKKCNQLMCMIQYYKLF